MVRFRLLFARIADLIKSILRIPTDPSKKATQLDSGGDATNAEPYSSQLKEQDPGSNGSQSEKLMMILSDESASQDRSLLLKDQILALTSTSRLDWSVKMASLNIARVHLALASNGCSWDDLPSDAWIEFCMDDAQWIEVLILGSRENLCNRRAKETVDRVTAAIVKETKEEKKK